MKAKLFILSLLLCFACNQANKPLTEPEKEKIIGEAKELVRTIIQVCEKPDPEALKSLYINSPDFVSMVGGNVVDFEQSLKGVDGYFAMVASQNSTIKDERYLVLDKTTVLYSANSRWEAKLKNDSTLVMDPTGMQFLLKKVDDKWMVLSWTEEAVTSK